MVKNMEKIKLRDLSDDQLEMLRIRSHYANPDNTVGIKTQKKILELRRHKLGGFSGSVDSLKKGNIMMPDFMRSDEKEGQVEGFTIFVDVAKFTKIVEYFFEYDEDDELKKKEKKGEQLGEIVFRMFAPVIELVNRRGGFITGFAGDAFTAIFPAEDQDDQKKERQVLYFLKEIHNYLSYVCDTIQVQLSIDADFDHELGVRSGVTYGKVDWSVINSDSGEESSYYFRGCPITSSVKRQKESKLNQTLIDEEIRSEFIKTLNYLDESENFTSTKSNLKELHNLESNGEYRENICSLFISFDDGEIDAPKKEVINAFIKRIMQELKEVEGVLKDVDFTTKNGGVAACFWGVEKNATEEDVKKAFMFALKMKEIRNTEFPELKFKIGISEGPAYLMNIRYGNRYYTHFLGHCVNKSFRLLDDMDEVKQDRDIAFAGMNKDIIELMKSFEMTQEEDEFGIMHEEKTDIINLKHIREQEQVYFLKSKKGNGE